MQRVKQLAQAGQQRLLSARQALLLQLSAMYRLGQTWQAVLILVRRLLLVLLLVLLPDAAVWTWLTALNFCFLALHLHCLPYERVVDNSLETLSLLSLSLQTTLLSLWPPPFMSQPLYSALCALDVGPLLPLLRLGRTDRDGADGATRTSSQQPQDRASTTRCCPVTSSKTLSCENK